MQPIRGLFPIVGTHGLPLDILVEECHERGVTIDMMDFIEGALADGWKPSTILSRFSETRLGADPIFTERLKLAVELACRSAFKRSSKTTNSSSS